jgi:hypothetical protein
VRAAGVVRGQSLATLEPALVLLACPIGLPGQQHEVADLDIGRGQAPADVRRLLGVADQVLEAPDRRAQQLEPDGLQGRGLPQAFLDVEDQIGIRLQRHREQRADGPGPLLGEPLVEGLGQRPG